MNRCPPSSFSKYWFGSASMTFHLKGRKAHIFFIKSLISLQESFIQIFMRSISGYVRNTIWPTKHHRSSRECLEDPTVDLSWPDDSQFWSSMTLPIDETEVPKTNDSQSNPLFFDVWNHVFFWWHFSFLTSWGWVKPTMSDHFSGKKTWSDPKPPSKVFGIHSKCTAVTPPRQTSPASWASKFAWYRHSPPLAPYGSTNYARSCNAPHLGLGGEGGVLLTWQQGHHGPRAKTLEPKRNRNISQTFPWVCRNQSLCFLKISWFLGMPSFT